MRGDYQSYIEVGNHQYSVQAAAGEGEWFCWYISLEVRRPAGGRKCVSRSYNIVTILSAAFLITISTWHGGGMLVLVRAYYATAQLLLLSLLSLERLEGAGHAVTSYTCHVSPVAPECDVRRLTGSGGEVWTFPLSARFHALDPPLPSPATAPAPSSPFTTFNLNKFSLSLYRCRVTTAKSVLECHLFLHNQQLTLK